MKITRRSPISGIDNTQEIDVTAEQLQAWRNGALAQEAFANATADQREFIISGITSTEWANYIGYQI